MVDPLHEYRRLRDESMQRARDHRGWAGNTYKGDVANARGWNRILVGFKARRHART